MKLLAAILVFMIAAQPVQAGFCDMDLTGNASAAAGQSHDSETSSDGHACCDPTELDDAPSCSDRVHCGACSITVAAIPIVAEAAARLEWSSPLPLTSGVVCASHAAPPYRPPIFIS